MDDSIIALLIGVGWGIVLFVFDSSVDLWLEKRTSETGENVISVLFVGGGSGAMASLTSVYFSAFAYALAGLGLTALVTVLVRY